MGHLLMPLLGRQGRAFVSQSLLKVGGREHFCVCWCIEDVKWPGASLCMDWFLLRRGRSKGDVCASTRGQTLERRGELAVHLAWAGASGRGGWVDVWMAPLGLCINSHVCALALQQQGPWIYVRALRRADCFLRSSVIQAALYEALSNSL